MSMNGMTGMNTEEAVRNITSFIRKCEEVGREFHDTYIGFFYNLRDLWASKNAVTFYEIWEDKCKLLYIQFDNEAKSICMNAIRAYNIVAEVNGSDVIYARDDAPFAPAKVNPFFESKNGITGMNIRMVRDFLIPTYRQKFHTVTESITQIPSSIALYDDENGQQVAFSNNINSMKTKFEGLITELFAELSGYLETEADTTQLAKEKSTDVLSGNA